MHRAADALDPVARPVVDVLQRHRMPDADDLLALYRRGVYALPGRWGWLRRREPEQRAVIPIDERRRVPKNVARLLRRGTFEVTFDRAFPQVVEQCATADGRADCRYPWLTPHMRAVFARLHAAGRAHSVETWLDGRLVGGEFGVTVGGLYVGESMFHLAPDAGKVALAHLTERLQQRGFLLFDVQENSSVNAQFGGHLVPRAEYRRLLAAAVAAPASFG